MIDDALGDEVRVTVIAAGFESDRQGYGGSATQRRSRREERPGTRAGSGEGMQIADVFATSDSHTPVGVDLNDEFDVPDFLR